MIDLTLDIAPINKYDGALILSQCSAFAHFNVKLCRKWFILLNLDVL